MLNSYRAQPPAEGAWRGDLVQSGMPSEAGLTRFQQFLLFLIEEIAFLVLAVSKSGEVKVQLGFK